MVWVLFGLILWQVGVDVFRERKWHTLSSPVVIPSKGKWSYGLVVFSGIMLMLGKMQWGVMGSPALGILALYILLVADNIRTYPYIVCTASTLYLCIHTLQPPWEISKKDIVSVDHIPPFWVITYSTEDEEKKVIHIDSRWFKDTTFLETWFKSQPLSALPKAA